MKCFILFLALCGSGIIAYAQQTKQSTYASAPMHCSVKGKIVSILNARDPDTGSICAKYPCMARVKIIEVLECGSSVSMSLIAGDTVRMKFAHSLHNTAKIYPRMKVRYPGLKNGSVFIADAEQRLKTGGALWMVYDYRPLPASPKGR